MLKSIKMPKSIESAKIWIGVSLWVYSLHTFCSILLRMNPKQSLRMVISRQNTNSSNNNSTGSHPGSTEQRTKSCFLFVDRQWNKTGAGPAGWLWKRRWEKLRGKRGWWITHDGPVTYIFCPCLTCQGVSKSEPNSWECTTKAPILSLCHECGGWELGF